jgi:hypothetical protein
MIPRSKRWYLEFGVPPEYGQGYFAIGLYWSRYPKPERGCMIWRKYVRILLRHPIVYLKLCWPVRLHHRLK